MELEGISQIPPRTTKDAKQVFAMGVGSQVQSFSRPHPLYMTHGAGSKLYDLDGNESSITC